MAGGAVEAEELGPARDLLGAGLARRATQGLLGDRTIGIGDDLGAAAVQVDVRRERDDLVLAVTRLLTLGLGLVVGRRHTTGMDLEVGRSRARADERGPAVLDTLQVHSVAGDARDVVDLLALGDERGLVLLGRRDLGIGNDGSGDGPGAEETGGDDERAGRLTATLGRDRARRSTRGLRRRRVRSGWVR